VGRRHEVSGVVLGVPVGCGAAANGAAAAVSSADGAAEGTSRTLKVSPPFRRGLLSSSRAWQSHCSRAKQGYSFNINGDMGCTMSVWLCHCGVANMPDEGFDSGVLRPSEVAS